VPASLRSACDISRACRPTCPHLALGDLESLLASVRPRNQQVVDVHADVARVLRVHLVLGVDKRTDAAAPLRLGYDVGDEGRLTRGLGSEDLDDPPARSVLKAKTCPPPANRAILR
jgi:hypothetical protein